MFFGKITETIYLSMVLVSVRASHVFVGFDRARPGILMSAGGSKLAWWLDPTGAIIVRILVCKNLHTG
jgi:hypothetical protein